MQISQMFKRKPCVFSIECFPPKQTANFDKMKDTLRTMRTLNPDFISVTYGAGGSTGGVSTVEVAEFLKNDLNVEPLAHMICMGSDKAKAAQLLDQLDAAAMQPQLNGVAVEFYGLGDTAGSQGTLSPQQVQWLKSFWQAFFDRTGAVVTFHADIVSGEALTENGHKVTPLAPAGAPTFIKVSAEQVDFQPDSTAFLDEDAARSALNELATQLKADSTSYVVAGSTAEVDNASREGAQALSLARAQAVRSVLVVAGVPADQITCLGLGNEPTSVRSANEAENRCVYVVSSDSVQAAEFRSVGQAES